MFQRTQSQSNTAPSNEKRQSAAAVNGYLTTAEGKKFKITAFFLSEEVKAQNEILEYLRENPEENLPSMMSHVEWQFVDFATKTGSVFAFGAKPAQTEAAAP